MDTRDTRWIWRGCQLVSAPPHPKAHRHKQYEKNESVGRGLRHAPAVSFPIPVIPIRLPRVSLGDNSGHKVSMLIP